MFNQKRSPRLQNQLQGLKAKRNGQVFEKSFERYCGFAGVTCKRIPDGCQQVGKGRLIRVRSPFDYILAYKNSVIFCDLKSTEAETFTYSKIDRLQLLDLTDMAVHDQFAGYIVEFKRAAQIVFFSTEKLNELQPQRSLAYTDGVAIGTTGADFQFSFKPLIYA